MPEIPQGTGRDFSRNSDEMERRGRGGRDPERPDKKLSKQIDRIALAC